MTPSALLALAGGCNILKMLFTWFTNNALSYYPSVLIRNGQVYNTAFGANRYGMEQQQLYPSRRGVTTFLGWRDLVVSAAAISTASPNSKQEGI
ncbi:hypothetical protein FOZ62_030732, partial [Perkinsus olseni]